jgi:hypothetical protein
MKLTQKQKRTLEKMIRSAAKDHSYSRGCTPQFSRETRFYLEADESVSEFYCFQNHQGEENDGAVYLCAIVDFEGRHPPRRYIEELLENAERHLCEREEEEAYAYWKNLGHDGGA